MRWPTDPLWAEISQMRIEPEGAQLAFAARLAGENGWDPRHAEAVVHEYRRFLYLAATAGAAVTPSEAVDQAWHLHLAYSRHYWEVLCGRILKRALHHVPSEGGQAATARFRARYAATLVRYREVFGCEPPASVWPPVGMRFAARPVRVDAARYWLVPKLPLGRTATLLAGAALVAACSVAAADGSGDRARDLLIVLLAAVMVMAFVALLVAIAYRAADRRRDGGCGAGCGGGRNDGEDGGCGGGCGGD